MHILAITLSLTIPSGDLGGAKPQPNRYEEYSMLELEFFKKWGAGSVLFPTFETPILRAVITPSMTSTVNECDEVIWSVLIF